MIAPVLALLLMTGYVFADEEASAARPLFNGKDMAGWSGEGYAVEDGAITATPQAKNLWTGELFANYVLDFEFMLTPGANNGLGIHYPGQGAPELDGMELQILDHHAPKYKDLLDYQYHGSIYTLASARQEKLKPAGEWNRQRVSVLGSKVMVELNGGVILDEDLGKLSIANPGHKGVKRRAGHLGWLGHGDRVAFREIRITEFPPAADTDDLRADGFTRIFDGGTLDGWKHKPGDTPNWIASNGILKHTGETGETNDLWSVKEYGDTTLVFDWRWNRPAKKIMRPVILPDGTEKKGEDGGIERVEVQDLDSGVYLRGDTKNQVNLWTWPIGSGEVYGYRTDGGMSPEVRAGVTPSANADKPIGEWNRMIITLVGDRLTVVSNGVTVIEKARLPGVAGRGPIALQHHGAGIDFANIWIKEL